MAIGSILTAFENRGTTMISNRDKAPSFNSNIYPVSNTSRGKQTLTHVKKLYMRQYLDLVPELTSIVNMVAGDIAETSFFEPINNNESGRNKVHRAKKFMQDVDMRKQDFSTIVDVLVTGEGYGWIGKLIRSQVEKLTKENLLRRRLPATKQSVSLAMKANFPDEDLVRPTRYRQMASSTVQNLYDETKITGYLQKVGISEKLYTPEQIIRYIFYDIDGRVEGFTPVRSILAQLELIWSMWQNMRSLMKNGGQPDRLYAAEEVDVNSVAFKRIEKELQKYHGMKNRHGSMLLNGKITVTDLIQLDQMQFKDMGIYVSSLMAWEWQVPRSRIPMMVQGANTKDDTGGNSEKSYYKNIELLQDLYINTQNKQLWIPFFGVVRRYQKGYKNDDLIEGQVKQTLLNNLTFQSNELVKVKKKFTVNYIMRYMNGGDQTIFEEDIEDIPKEDLDIINGVNQDNSQFKQNQASNEKLNTSKDKQNVKDKKKSEQASVAASRGKSSGMGKEFSLKDHLEFKERQKVSFATFMKLYNEDKSFNINPPRVFMSEKDGITRFTYKSTDFVYDSMTPTGNVSKVQLMNFRQIMNVDEDEILDALDMAQPEVSDND